ncbi:hypothetical protein [Lelliottia amnigena]
MNDAFFNIYFSVRDYYFRNGVVKLTSDILSSLENHGKHITTVNIVDDINASDLAIIHRNHGDSFLKCNVSDHILSHPEKDLNLMVIPDYGRRPNICKLSSGDMLPVGGELLMIESLLKTNIISLRTIPADNLNIPMHPCKNCRNIKLTEYQIEILYFESIGTSYYRISRQCGRSVKSLTLQKYLAMEKLKILNKIDYSYFLLNNKAAISKAFISSKI